MWKYSLGCVEGVHNYMIGVIESYYDWWHIRMICISNKNICCTWCSVATYIMCTKIMGSSLYVYHIFFFSLTLVQLARGECTAPHHSSRWSEAHHIRDSCGDGSCWFQQWHVVLEVSYICLYILLLYMYMYYDIMLIATLKISEPVCMRWWQISDKGTFYERIPLTAHSQLAIGSIV